VKPNEYYLNYVCLQKLYRLDSKHFQQSPKSFKKAPFGAGHYSQPATALVILC
jgi:hypothetical protein